MDAFQYETVTEAVVKYCRMMWEKGFVDGNGGNVSVRLDRNTFIVTPTLFSKADVRAVDLCLVDSSGALLKDRMEYYGHNPDVRPTSEFVTHLAVYCADPSARAVVHTHPPYTCSYAFTSEVPVKPLDPESAIWIGNLAMVPYAGPGSDMLAFKVEQMASGRNALILQNHGLLAWGKSIRDAYWRTEIVEAHCMKSHLVECRNAAPRNFTAEECRELEALRSVFLNGRDK